MLKKVCTTRRIVLAIVVLLFSSGCPSSDESRVDTPARRAARGETIPLVIKVRKSPIEVNPISGLEDVISEDVMRKALVASLPMWHPPSVPSLVHELRLWGLDCDFDKDFVGGEGRSGSMMVDTLLSDHLCSERTVRIGSGKGGSYLIDSPYGIHAIQSGSYDAVEYRGETHYGKLTSLMGEVGLPLNTPVVTSSGHTGTLADVLQDTIMRFRWDRELEFVGCSFAYWLPPEKSWKNQFDDKFTFDELVLRLIDRPFGNGSCGGCHVPYTVVMILRVDEQHTILGSRVRQRAYSWLRQLSGILEETQLPDGSWERDWGRTGQKGRLFNDPVLDRITIIGHHLEWMAFVPDDYRLPKEAIAKAVACLGREIDKLSPLPYRSFKSVLPCSHAARALCCCKGVDPFGLLLSLMKPKILSTRRLDGSH